MANICLTDFRKIAKDYLGSEDAVDDFSKKLKDTAAIREATRAVDKEKAMTDKLKDMLDEEERNKTVKKRQYALAKLKEHEIKQDLERRVKENKKGYMFSLLSRISNTLTEFKGGNINTDNKIQVIRDNMSSQVLKLFSKDEWSFLTQTKWVKGKFEPVNDLDIMNAMDKEESASPQAKEIVRKMTEFNTKSGERLNELGADISLRDDYLQRQSHDVEKMLSATGSVSKDLSLRLKLLKDKIRTKSVSDSIKDMAFNRWKSSILPELNTDITFKGANIDRFLRNAYDRMVTGIRMTREPSDDLLVSIKKPPTLASRIGEGRVFRFKDNRSWYRYNQTYGQQSIEKSFLRSLDKNSELMGLLEDWGPNPVALYRSVKRFAVEKDRSLKIGKKPLLFDIEGVADARFNEISHAFTSPINSMASKVFNRIMSFERMTKLGGVLLTSFLDVTQGMANLSEHGINPMKQLNEGLYRGIKNKEEFAKQIDIAGRLILGHYGSRLDPISQRGNYENLFFKLSGIDWWDTSFRTGHASLLLKNLADNADKKLQDFSHLNKILPLYDINSPEWDMMRKYAKGKVQGIDMITPQGIDNIPNDIIKQYQNEMKIPSYKSLKSIRRDLKVRLQSFLYDQTNNAHTFPDASSKATIKFNSLLPSDHPLMMINRLFTQFQTWTVTMTRRSLLRRVINKKWGPLSTQLSASLPLAYAVISAKSILNGETTPSLSKSDTWAEMLTLSGGLGYIGSFIAGDYGKYGFTIAGGPAISDVNAVIKGIANTLQGKNIGSQWYHTLKGNIPGANLFYLKGALDRLLLNSIGQVMLPANYAQKVEQRMQQNTGQRFFIPM